MVRQCLPSALLKSFTVSVLPVPGSPVRACTDAEVHRLKYALSVIGVITSLGVHP
jgi:hypothetical protein